MTAILAAPVAGRGVLVGSDRALTDTGQHSRHTVGPKVLRVGRWLVGASGVVLGDWEALTRVDPLRLDAPTDWESVIAPDEDTSVLLVRGSRIVLGEVHKGRWCWGETRGTCAIGSGGSEVRAAWLALAAYEADHEKRMRAALRASARINITVGGPFDVVWSVSSD